MTLYIENPVSFPDTSSISVNTLWHQNAALLAAASFSQDRGGFLIVFDELGEPVKDINYPVHRSYQVTALTWHPERTILVSGWENGEIKVWNGTDRDFTSVAGPHKSPITLLGFSEKGGRLVSCDSTGSLVGWKMDSKGQTSSVFHLDLKEAITHLTFRLTVKSQPDYDVEGLAKAAVAGDEHALDMFSNWRPKTTARKFKIQDGQDNMSFFIATQMGSIYYVNQAGSCSEVLNTESLSLSYVVYHPTKDNMIVVMEGLTIGYFSVDRQGTLKELAKVKLSGRLQTRSLGTQGLTWAGQSSLAILTGDLTVRVWDLDTNDNYVLPTTLKPYSGDDKSSSVSEIFTCLAYSKINQTLCAGTNIGRIYFWIKNPNIECENAEDAWELSNISNVSGTIKQLMWGSFMMRMPLLSVNCVTTVYIMKEQTICSSFSEKIWVTQKTANQGGTRELSILCRMSRLYTKEAETSCARKLMQFNALRDISKRSSYFEFPVFHLMVLLESARSKYLLEIENQISDIAICKKFVAFTNGRSISVYNITWNVEHVLQRADSTDSTKINEFSVKFSNTFICENEGILVHDKIILAINSNKVLLLTTTGSILSTLTSNISEGEPIGMDVTGHYLTIFTMEGYLKIYDLAEGQPKLHTPTKNMYDIVEDFGEIIQAKTNSKGNKVALTLAAANLVPDGKIYIWDIESDTVVHYDFRKYESFDRPPSIEDYFDDAETKKKNTQENYQAGDTNIIFNDICKNRIPLSLHWSEDDPRLLVCNARKLKIPGHMKKFAHLIRSHGPKTLKEEDHIVITMFISAENKIKMHDIRPLDPEAKLLGVAIPYIVTLQKLSIVRDLMSDFSGLEDCDKDTKEAVLNFSYNLSIGNMDAAFKSIKLVQSQGVWTSLAKMCVKTRRLDVAGVCLGHMGNAKAARALRLAMADDNLPQEAKVAVLAIHLGLLDDAEQLYNQCERYDLLNKLLRCRNKMESSLNVAETKDRINLRNTEHAWARILEQQGDLAEAAIRYEKAGTHKFDIPRMLSDHPQQLRAFMSKTKDKDLLKWWGQYLESQGDMNSALKVYSTAGDVYSQVRVLCFLGEESRASELTKTSNDKAAFYHMARYYETVSNVEEAVNFFTKATAYCNAVRLCKENNMMDELWNLGLVVSNREKLEIARYFEDVGDLEKAVVLYHRGGMLHKALDLAFKTQQFDILQEIATRLDADSDPALIEKCAQYFVSNEQYDKAVDLLAIAKKYKQAIQLCTEKQVRLTEDLTEKLTPEKDAIAEDLRVSVLETLAESLMLQGDYHLATKKFTQAGDKVRAMKSLLKSGDTEKIIFFAGISRQREIYIMAANYLQSLDWQNQPDVLRNIITFYSKGKALDLLANFYVACAQVEIDEFQNYEKAYEALTEASKCLQKITNPKDPNQIQRAMDIVQQRHGLVKKFVDVRRLFERGDLQAGVTQCRQLLMLNGKELEVAVRRGDIYALMIHSSIKTENFIQAKQLIGELRQFLASEGSNTPISYYLNKEMVENVAKGLGVPPSTLVPMTPKTSTSQDQDNEEPVDEILEE